MPPMSRSIVRPSQSAPLFELPDELLARIFFIVCDGIFSPFPPRSPMIRRKHGVHVIAAVCFRWKTITERALVFLVLDLPFESSAQSINKCRQLLHYSPPIDMDIDIDLTFPNHNQWWDDTQYLLDVLEVILPHNGRWRSLTIVVRATSYMAPVLQELGLVTSTPRLRSFKFEAAHGSQYIPALPIPGLLDASHPPVLTHLSISGGQLIMSQEFDFPHVIDLEILDKAEERELTLHWRDVASVLRAAPSLRALKLDCNIDYSCLKRHSGLSTEPGPEKSHNEHNDASASSMEINSEGPSGPSSGRHICPTRPCCSHASCKAAFGPIFLRDLLELRLNRYDMEEINALLLQLEAPSLRSLTLSSLEVYPNVYATTVQTGARLTYPSFISAVREKTLANIDSLSLIEFEFDEGTEEDRIEFLRVFLDAFPNMAKLHLTHCPCEEILTGLLPRSFRSMSSLSKLVPAPRLALLKITGGSTGLLPTFVRVRSSLEFPLQCLLLVNTVIDHDPNDLKILGEGVEYFDYVAVSPDAIEGLVVRTFPEDVDVPSVRARNIDDATREVLQTILVPTI